VTTLDYFLTAKKDQSSGLSAWGMLVLSVTLLTRLKRSSYV